MRLKIQVLPREAFVAGWIRKKHPVRAGIVDLPLLGRAVEANVGGAGYLEGA
jgi:hypothetical protein